MGLRFDPVGQGQFRRIVQDIINLERQPVRNLEARKAKVQTKIQLFQDFKSRFTNLNQSVAEIENFRKFKELKVDLGDGETLVDVTLDKEVARAGSYQIEIEQVAGRSAMISNGFETPDEPHLGIGYVIVYDDEGSHEIFIDDDDSSLKGIAARINSNRDMPVTAEVVQDWYDEDAPWRLVIKGKKDGYFNYVEFPDFYFFGGTEDLWIEDEIESDNAYLKLDGFEIEANGNNIKDFLEGVNLDIKNARPDQPFNMVISFDTEKVTGKVKALVDNINKVLEFINEQNRVDERSDTSTMFTGDSGIQNIEYRLRNLLHEGFPIGDPDEDDFRVVHLSDLGIEFTREGILNFNEDKFTKALDDDFEGVADGITGDFGFAFQLKTVLGAYTRPLDGILALRERGLQSRISQIDRDIESKEVILDKRAQALTERFSRLQSSLGALQQQSQFLTAALGTGGGGNLVTQLLGG